MPGLWLSKSRCAHSAGLGELMCAWLRPLARARWRARPRCGWERICFLGRGTGAPPASATASAARRGGRQSNQRRLAVVIALRTVVGTRRVDVCVAAPAGARDLDVCGNVFRTPDCRNRAAHTRWDAHCLPQARTPSSIEVPCTCQRVCNTTHSVEVRSWSLCGPCGARVLHYYCTQRCTNERATYARVGMVANMVMAEAKQSGE